MQLFYSPDITSDSLCALDPEESRHAVRVLRLRQGDAINVTDGCGTLYRCTIEEASDKACVVSPQTVEQSDPRANKIHLAVAPTKNPSRMEWLVEKAVEMGVGSITLLQCDHSERSFQKTDRLQKIALSAMKQSLRTILPPIHPAVPLKSWLTDKSPLLIPHSSSKFIAHCEANQPRTPLGTALETGKDAIVLIGPEGDFSTGEITLALEHGYQPVSFGPSRLRTETAAIYAVAAFNLTNDRTP